MAACRASRRGTKRIVPAAPLHLRVGVFHAYVLRPTGTPSQYTVVYDSGLKTVPLARRFRRCPNSRRSRSLRPSRCKRVMCWASTARASPSTPESRRTPISLKLPRRPRRACASRDAHHRRRSRISAVPDAGSHVLAVRPGHADDHRSRHGRRGDGNRRPEDGRHLRRHRHQPRRRLRRAADGSPSPPRASLPRRRPERNCSDRVGRHHQHLRERERVWLPRPS